MRQQTDQLWFSLVFLTVTVIAEPNDVEAFFVVRMMALRFADFPAL
jgi:hypothetical protein